MRNATTPPGLTYWKAKKRPSHVPKMRDRQCWTNALYLVERYPTLRYVVGWAFTQGSLIKHAWCVTRAGYVVDPTWKEPGHIYLGKVLDKRTVRFLLVSKGLKPWEVFYD